MIVNHSTAGIVVCCEPHCSLCSSLESVIEGECGDQKEDAGGEDQKPVLVTQTLHTGFLDRCWSRSLLKVCRGTNQSRFLLMMMCGLLDRCRTRNLFEVCRGTNESQFLLVVMCGFLDRCWARSLFEVRRGTNENQFLLIMMCGFLDRCWARSLFEVRRGTNESPFLLVVMYVSGDRDLFK